MSMESIYLNDLKKFYRTTMGKNEEIYFVKI